MKTSFKQTISLLALAATLLGAQTARAQYTYNVDINTLPLANDGNGPYSLDFVLSNGDTTVGNTVTISNFAFAGGSATGSPTDVTTNASGDIGTSTGVVTLTNDATGTNIDEELYQAFTAGTTNISFNVSLTQNPGEITPDALSITLLNAGGSAITTSAPDTSSLVVIPIAANGIGNTASDGAAYYSVSPTASGVTAATPEPSTYALLVAGLAMLVVVRRRKLANI